MYLWLQAMPEIAVCIVLSLFYIYALVKKQKHVSVTKAKWTTTWIEGKIDL